MFAAPLLLLLAQSQDAAELARLGIQELRRVEAAVAAGRIQGLDVPDAFFGAALKLRKACEADGAPAEAYEAWSEALLNAGDLRNALAAVTDGLAVHAAALALHLQHGRVLTAQAGTLGGEKQKELWREAERVYAAAAELDRKAVAPCLRRGEILVYLGEAAAARDAWRAALARDPQQVDLGAMAQWLPYTQACEVLDGLQEAADGEDPLLVWYRGMAAYYGLFKAPSAELWQACRQDFERALELNPAYDSSWYFLAAGAEFYAGQLDAAGDADRARQLWREAGTAWSHYLAGNAGAQQIAALPGMPDGGAQFVDKMKWYGATVADPRRPEAAVRLFAWVTRARPQDPEAWNNLALIHRDSGHAQESLDAYEKALRLRPDDPQVMNDLAVILHYYLRRDDARAKELYRQAIAKAEELLAGSELPAGDRDRIQVALRDARNNLAKLEKGDRRNG